MTNEWLVSPFPANELRASGGTISAIIFENTLTSVPEGLYWSIKIDYRPIIYRDEELQPGMGCDLLTINARDWKDLEGTVLEGNWDEIDGSFYVYEHDYALYSKIMIDQRSGHNFRVNYTMAVEFSGYDQRDADDNMLVSADIVIPFTGLIIPSFLVSPSPDNARKAAELAERYVDILSYEQPCIDTGVFVLNPRL